MLRPHVLGGVPAWAVLWPLILALFAGCGRGQSRGETRKLDEYALTVETPSGWTGGGSGGTYEYRSPDGTGRLRIAPVEGGASLAGLKDAQLLAGTGAQPVTKVFPTSPTKIGTLSAERGRFAANDGRVYDVVAVQTPKGVVLFQTSVSSERASESSADVEKLFTTLRQSIQLMR
jgi:hypothetical protein